MKKLMRKLVLSSFALGLAVITLSTTTFAWYTSNVNVQANNVTGESATSGSALLMISNDYTTLANQEYPTNWETAIDNVQRTDNAKLEPLAIKADYSELYAWGSSTSAVVESKVTGKYIEFTLSFKLASDTTQDLFLSGLTLTNDDVVYGGVNGAVSDFTGLPYKDIIGATHEHINTTAGFDASTIYRVDILRSILIQTETVLVNTDNPTGKLEGYDLYDPEGLCKINDNLGTDFNAHAYYNEVMELTDSTTPEAIDTAGTTYGAKVLGSGSNKVKLYDDLPTAATPETQNHFIQITFRIFLNGWDKACFDACQGQSIKVNLSFTTEEGNALTYSE